MTCILIVLKFYLEKQTKAVLLVNSIKVAYKISILPLLYVFYKIIIVLAFQEQMLNYYFTGKYVPEEAVLDMKANFKLPPENDENFDYIEFIELPREKATPLVEQ